MDPADETPLPIERLNELNRVLVEARMLDTGPLTAEQIAQVRKDTRAYIDAHGITFTRLGRETGWSPAVVSTFFKGDYKGDADAVARQLNVWMERDARRTQAARPKDYVDTGVAETMRSIAYAADKRLCMAAIVAPAGSGKTKVLKTLAQEMGGLYYYCRSKMSSRDLVAGLSALLGYRRLQARRSEHEQFVISALAHSKRIIFLDEAQQIGSASIGLVRSIHDEAGCPIVMAGTADILDLVNDRTDGRGQFSSRCIQFNILDQVRDAESPNPGGRSQGDTLFSVED